MCCVVNTRCQWPFDAASPLSRERMVRTVSRIGGSSLGAIIADFCNKICQKQTSSLLDHLIGAGEQRWRHGNAERPGGLKIDRKLELGWLQNRQVRRLLALEDADNVKASLSI